MKKILFALLLAALSVDAADAAFRISCQAYTFHLFTTLEAVDKTAQAGVKYIELLSGQRFSSADRTALNPNLSDAHFAELQACLQSNGVQVASYYTDIPKDEAAARKIFAFAHKLGASVLTTEAYGSIDTIEKMAKEFDMRVGFHEHKKTADPANTLWSAENMRDFLKGRDPRVGACPDIGHWATSGIIPVDGIKTLAGRIVSMHLKDRPKIGVEVADVPLGTGASDIAGVLTELRRQGFDGFLTIEYEANFENNIADVKKCAEFIRQFEASAK